MSSSVRKALVIKPPTMGAAIRFITSAPDPVAQSSGIRPTSMVPTVMSFGRTRCTVPSMCAAITSSKFLRRPARRRSSKA